MHLAHCPAPTRRKMSELASLKDAEWLRDEALGAVLRAMRAGGGTARIAGGAVRNGLLAQPVNDIDIATDQTPENIIKHAKSAGLSVHPTGLDHGTLTVVAGGQDGRKSFEVTTLRVDVETDGRRAKVEFTDDWAADAHRRDFTINALYCDEQGEILDFVGGLKDLRRREVRFVGSPSERIAEDHLRILRFFRFHAWYGAAEPNAQALAACVKARKSLSKLSRERIRQEFFKLAVAPGAVSTLEVMLAKSVLAPVLPGRVDLHRFARLCSVEAAQSFEPDPLRRLRALSQGQNADQLRQAFVLSNEETKRLEALGPLPPLSPVFRDAERQTLLYWHGSQTVIDKLLLDWSATTVPADDASYAAFVAEAKAWERPRLPIGGKDLQAAGIAEGKELGRLLQALEDWWVAGGFKAGKAELMARLAALR